jgi:hypothetical protein
MQEDAQKTLRELARLEDAGRRPRTEVWFPLLVFGLIDIPGAALAWIIGREHLGSYFLPMNFLGGSRVPCITGTPAGPADCRLRH